MVRRIAILVSSWLTLAVFFGTGRLSAAEPDAAGVKSSDVEFFEKKIRPVLVAKCYKCHSGEMGKVKGGLSIDTRDGIRAGGESGPAVVPGNPDSSTLIEAIRHESFEMPPDEQLAPEIIADFVTWISSGAVDPREGKPGLIRREINFEEGRKHWAFQKPGKAEPPAVKNAAWARDEIDRFVLAGLEKDGLTPAADADRRVLIRRVYFDLIGLPPTPDQVEAFVNDTSPDALAAVVDSLLQSKHFGERWGRHWLDVARYGESNGRERNAIYPHAWRYRDYVINSFNADKPWDQFVREQIAGDLLPADTDAKRDEQFIATGFLAIGPKLLNERNAEIFRMDIVDEQIDTSTRAIMAFTVACARCHDHKFDPVPTAEYYSLAGIFRSSETLYSTGGGQGVRQNSKLYPLASKPANGTAGTVAQTDVKPAEVATADSNPATAEPDKDKLAALNAEFKTLQRQIAQLGGNPKNKNNKNAKKAKADTQVAKQLAELISRRKEIQQEINRLNGGAVVKGKPATEAATVASPNQPVAMGVIEGQIADVKICIRGEVDDRGESVKRGYLTILSDGPRPLIESSGSGRLEFASWLADRNNPLTSRAIVNRLWQHLFGYGLVRSVDNFGTTGDLPTYPELLDHLAVSFMDDGWSVKRMIRRIVLSRSYQMSSDFDEKNFAADPDNFRVWRMNPRRLDAESLRDAILAVSGQIDLTPAEASIVAKFKDNHSVGQGAGTRESDFDIDSRHRSVYLPIVRNAVPDALRVFDFAEPSILVGERTITTVPAQALYMMNNPFVIEQSDHLARKLLAEADLDDAGRIQRLYQLTLCRPATDREMELATHFVSQTAEKLGRDKSATAGVQPAWSSLCQALLASGEFRYLE